VDTKTTSIEKIAICLKFSKCDHYPEGRCHQLEYSQLNSETITPLMSLESPTTLRQDLFSVIQDTPEANLPELLEIIRVFQQRTLLGATSSAQQQNTSQIQWQQAVDAINSQNETTIEQRRARIAKLIDTLNANDDIEEQQQALADIRSSTGISI
jgi:hypothetical protein